MNQNQHAVKITKDACKEMGLDVTPNETDYRSVLNVAQKRVISSKIFEGMQSGEIPLSETKAAQCANDEKALRRYASALLASVLLKSSELNGGVQYTFTPSTTGTSRKRDDKIKALNAALKLVQGDPEKETIIKEAISERLAELNIAKAPDLSALDDDLKAKLGL